ncbi:MFS transporter [Rhodovulum sulfidophilum]|uniref:MFS transporter n=1 Tax=Rhodovulum sulfidophilum TaxID=35806 RepID=UPI001F2E20A8|nr:MFS transporter [Rhodovulum sulfidophilum]MCE8440848.1 MFS transporter [Rhodovulum sulfidophilum]MCE8469208.1 MFS transporter [Rhodovulum sulfidophilum]
MPHPYTAPAKTALPKIAFPVLASVQAVLIFTITLIAAPLPPIDEEFGLATADLVLLQVACGLPYSGLLLLGGALSDRFGGPSLFRMGLGGVGLSSLGAALSSSFEMLVTMRALQGVAAAMVAPAAVAHVAALYPDPEKFDGAMARWGGISVLGAAAGTVLSAVLTTWISWRWMFAPSCLTMFVALSLRSSLLPVVRGRMQAGRLDFLGALLALTALMSGGFALSTGSDHGWTSPRVCSGCRAGKLRGGSPVAPRISTERQSHASGRSSATMPAHGDLERALFHKCRGGFIL